MAGGLSWRDSNMTCPPLVFIANQIEMHPVSMGVFHKSGDRSAHYHVER